MRQFKWEFWATLGLVVCGFGIALLVTGCDKQQLGQIQDASNKRAIVCEFIKGAKSNPTVEAARKVCDAGGDLEEIARAYGGCEAQ